MDVDIPEPNPALTAVLRSERIRDIVFERAQTAAALYQAHVAKRTGALAASAHPSTEIGGVRHDRHIGVLTVGGGSVDYALAHEFGTGDHPQSTHNLDRVSNDITHAARDLNHVLEELGA
jgi:hypothetical protein